MFINDNTITEKRKFRRIRFSDAVHYHMKEESGFGGCLACDIGEGGMMVNFNDFVPVNSEMTLQLRLPSVEKIVDVTARVAWLQKLPYSDRYHIGLVFSKIDSIAKEGIRHYIKSHHS